MNTLFIRSAGSVKRFHTHRTIQTQTVAAHSWGVAAILFEICPNPSLNLIKYALFHDMPEHTTGDVPAPAKWASSELSLALAKMEALIDQQIGTGIQLTDEEVKWMKFADMLEFMWFVIEELSMGNESMLDCWNTGCKWFKNHGPLPSEVLGMLELMTSINPQRMEQPYNENTRV